MSASGVSPTGSGGPDGATPITVDEAAGLKLSWVTTRGELNAVEQANIVAGLRRRKWTTAKTANLLDAQAVRALHQNLFGEVWSWAGTYRSTERNIGVAPWEVAACVVNLVEDAKLWIRGDRPMSVDEGGVRFHHRLAQIHPFPNGNGRHARAFTDLLLTSLGAEPFSWGRASLERRPIDLAGATRQRYITALRRADGHDFAMLNDFVRS